MLAYDFGKNTTITGSHAIRREDFHEIVRIGRRKVFDLLSLKDNPCSFTKRFQGSFNMVGEHILAIIEDKSDPALNGYVILTNRCSYEFTPHGFREIEWPDQSGSILPRSWTSLRIIEVRNLKPTTALKLEGNKVIIYESCYNPFEDIVSTCVEFHEEEEARAWQDEYEDMDVLEMLPD